MPGFRVNMGPTRPRKQGTISTDRLRYGESSGIPGMAFGLLFSCTGCIALYMALRVALGSLGLFHPLPNPNNDSWWFVMLESLLVACMGAGHLILGSMLLFQGSRCIDRLDQVVTERRGWFGLGRRSRPLSDYHFVAIRPSISEPTHSFDKPMFDVVLVAGIGTDLIMGTVTQSEELAEQFAKEIGDFCGLPIRSLAAVSDPTHAMAPSISR